MKLNSMLAQSPLAMIHCQPLGLQNTLANSMSKYLRDSFFRSNAHASFIRKRKTIQGLGLQGLRQKTQACNEKKVQRQAHTVTGLDIERTH